MSLNPKLTRRIAEALESIEESLRIANIIAVTKCSDEELLDVKEAMGIVEEPSDAETQPKGCNPSNQGGPYPVCAEEPVDLPAQE